MVLKALDKEENWGQREPLDSVISSAIGSLMKVISAE